MEGFKYQINADNGRMNLHLRETFEYKDLIMLNVKNGFISKYKQTILGPAWAVIQPLLTTVVFTIIFGNLAKLTTADVEGSYFVPGFLFYMIGNICWGYFSATLSATSNTFLANRATMGKVYYPRLVAPISTSLTNLISFGIQIVLFIVCWIYYYATGETSITLSPMLLLVPVLVLQMILLSVGCGIIISAVTTKFRDLVMLVSFGLELWKYGTPIAYGLRLIPEKYMSLYLINPMTTIVTAFRYAVFGFGHFNLTFYLIGWLETIVLFMIGLVLFSSIERTFMDTI